MPNFADKHSAPGASPATPSAPGPVPGKHTQVEQAYAPVQQRASGEGGGGGEAGVHAAAAQGIATPATALPHRDAIQRAFGRHDVSSVQAHVGGEAAASTQAMGADAYATGNHVVLGKGADLFTTAHEAAHVVQQRGGVQLKGGVGQAGDHYEQHADAVAERVGRGESAEALLDQHAPGGGAAAGGAAIQRKMGMEMEVGRRVTSAQGQDLPGDTNLIDHQYFTVVSDKRLGYSNVEFVMKVFDQLAGTEAQAQAALTLRLDAMRTFYDQLYANDGHRDLGAIPGVGTGQNDLYRPMPKDPQQPNGPTWADARMAPTMGNPPQLPADDRGQRRGELFCHFTVGYPIQKMHEALTYLGGDDAPNQPRDYYNQNRLTEAVTVGNTLAQQFAAELHSDAERDEFKGAISLMYTQVAAFAIKTRGGPGGGEKPGQIKNNTPVLSRVPLRDIYDSLSANVQAVLHNHHDAIVDAIANELDGTADYNDPDVRHLPGLPPVTLGDYAASGVGHGPQVSQQRVFGGMYERSLDPDHGMNLIPVEIRSFRKQFMSFDEVRAAAAELVRQSRALLLPQQPAQPQPQAQPPQGPPPPQAPVHHAALVNQLFGPPPPLQHQPPPLDPNPRPTKRTRTGSPTT